jgi:Ca2+-transporting ATPase
MLVTALRTILLAYIDGDVESDTYAVDLTFVSVFGIEDPLRVEVPFAVNNCKNAGIIVRMITGDNIQTAKKIAEQCGILTPTGVAMEGSTFENLSDDQIDDVLPRLQVLARSAPRHKHKLVKRYVQVNTVGGY